MILASDSPFGIPPGESEANLYLIFPVFPEFDLNQCASTVIVLSLLQIMSSIFFKGRLCV